MRLLHQVPDELLILNTTTIAPFLHLLGLDVGGVLSHLIQDMLLPGVELGLAARLEEEIVNAPVIQVIAKGHDTHLVHHVELVGPGRDREGA